MRASNHARLVAMIAVGLAVGCTREPTQTTTAGDESSNWHQLGTLGSAEKFGLFVLEVTSAESHTEPAVPGQSSPGLFVTGRIEEIIAGDPFDFVDEPYNDGIVERWAVGTDVVVSIPDVDFRCPSSGQPLEQGARIIVAPARSPSLRRFHRDGHRTIEGGFVNKFFCVSPNGAVAVDDAYGNAGVDEVATVTLAQFRAYAAAAFNPNRDEALTSVSQACEALGCGGSTSCFFGAGCVPIEFRAPPGTVNRAMFPPDGRAARPDAGN